MARLFLWIFRIKESAWRNALANTSILTLPACMCVPPLKNNMLFTKMALNLAYVCWIGLCLQIL